ncbi:phosphate/phosphite/phosphonate ABC transporter substrate-binding protein [Terasakiella pusilla]|uniref:phosphate/phosphite/phosphonate ABC transporter substrate-binding protein n=1 Tax=Terasakiella pusilla TaxID=64973 RepID=UPI003AA7CC15
MPYIKTLRILFAGLLLTGIIQHASPARSSPLYFGIVPQQAASKLAQSWVPFMAELSKQTGLDIRFATMKDIPTFERCLAKGAYDIAYMNPYHYTVFSEKSGYRAFAHQSEKKLKGLIVVKKDAPYENLQDLNNLDLAFPSPAAFGASLLPRAEMKKRGMTITPNYVKSHDSVYKSVAAGLFPAGGGVKRTFANIPEELHTQLRVIYTTSGYTPHAFAVGPHMDEEKRLRLQTTFQHLSQTRPDLLAQIGMKGFVSAQNSAWDDVRALGLSQEETEIIQDGSVKCRLD